MKAGKIYLLTIVGFLALSCTSKTEQQKKLSKEVIPQAVDVINTTSDTLIKAEKSTANNSLQPIERDITSGLPISADSLSMRTEHDYYPAVTQRIKVIITNHTKQEYDSGEEYSLVYYNEARKEWELQPANQVVNSVLWLLTPQCPSRQQTIEFYTDKNHPGKYRIYKSFNRKTRIAYAEFELISSEQQQKLLDRISVYYDAHPKSAIMQNLNSWGFKDNDTLYMDWKVNSAKLRNEFRQKVLNYSAMIVNDGKPNIVAYFNEPMSTDTFGIKMYTEQKVYPVGTESVSVKIVNRSGRRISMGTWYSVLQKKGDKWISLSGATIWNLVELCVQPNGIYSFSASLYPSLNSIKPGIYRVVKSIDIGDAYPTCNIVAEFYIGDISTESQENERTEPTSKPLSESTMEDTEEDIVYRLGNDTSNRNSSNSKSTVFLWQLPFHQREAAYPFL